MDNQLFSGSDPFYKIEPVINRFIRDPNLIYMLNPAQYLAGIDTLVVNLETNTNGAGSSVISTPISTLTSITGNNMGTAYYNEIGNGIIFSSGPKTTVLNQIVSGMPNFTDSSVSKNHKSFDDKMRQVMERFSFFTWNIAINLLPVPLNSSCSDSNNCVFNAINLACEELRNMPVSKKTTLMNLVADTGKNCMIDIVMNNFDEAAANDFTPNSINPGNSNTSPDYSSLTSKKFFEFRRALYNRLDIPANILSESDINVKLYVKKILSDLYIKSCYPAIQYDIISAFAAKFQKTGDFINMRFSLLAKITYVRNWITEFVSIYNNATADDTVIANTQNTNTIITQILTLLNTYLQRVNNIDLNSDQDQLKKIMKQLHLLSDEVNDSSQKIDTLKDSVNKGQLSLRNTVYMSELMDKKYNNTQNIFYLLIIVAIILLIIYGVLLFLNMNKQLYILSGCIIAVLLLTQVISFIISLYNKSK